MGTGGPLLSPPNTRRLQHPHPTLWMGPTAAEESQTDLFHPSQDDVCAPPVVHGDLQADPQRPASTGPLSPIRHSALGPTLPAPADVGKALTHSPHPRLWTGSPASGEERNMGLLQAGVLGGPTASCPSQASPSCLSAVSCSWPLAHRSQAGLSVRKGRCN